MTSYSPFGLKADTVVGYTFQAETLCPSCVLEAVNPSFTSPDYSPEHALDFLAKNRGIDRQDEHSFDSDDFPKVIFATDIDDEPCDQCANMLIEGF